MYLGSIGCSKSKGRAGVMPKIYRLPAFFTFFYEVLCAEETKFSAKGRYPVHFPIDPGRAVGKNDGDSCPIDLKLEHFLGGAPNDS